MEVESAESGDDIGAIKEKQQENGTSGDQVNGLKNGYASDKHKSHHKSEHKDKHRDKDKHRSKEHKSSSKDKHSSSSSKDKERHSSSHKSSSKDKERDRHREKEKDRHRDDKDRDKDKKSSSSTKDKDRENKHRDKDKDREHKSGSSSKDKDRDRERHKDREGHDKDKHRSRDKDKDRHSSSSKDKHRDKDKHHSSSRDKERKEKRERESDELKSKQEENDSREVEVKQEITENINVSAASSCDYSMSQFKDEPKEEIEEEEEEDEQPSQEEEEEEEEEQPSQEEEDEEELKPKVEVDSDEDVPLSARSSSKKRKKVESDDDYQNEDEDEDVPLSARKKPKKEKKKRKHAMSDDDEEDYEDVKPIKKEKNKKRAVSDEEEYDDFKPIKKEKKQKKAKAMTDEVKTERGSPKKGGRKKKEEEEQEVWKWWEEEKKEDGTKWNFLEHKGPVFAPPYERLPESVKFYYDGKEMHLSSVTEEVAGFYAKMLDHDYTTKDVFNNNFFKDWRKCMSSKEQATITDLKKCNFKPMHAYFMDIAEKNRNRTKEEKLALKEKNEEIIKEYGFCKIDGHKEKIGNFKIEPPGLFRGRGEHPKMGMLKKRVEAEHIIINCSKNSVIPKAPEGHKWKEVRHDPSVTWLASWTENVQNQVKYIMLNPSSKLKGEKDMAKYETARRLHKCIDKIRREYKDDWKSKEMRVRQRAVALYFIDRLALRAGNEKDEDQADTVGCCSLRVEHIELHEKKDDKEYVVCFDFLGKDSIRYYNEVPVEKRVFKNLQLFIENKSPGDDLFDRLNTSILNKHLNELMEGLTAKVFRTYNASITLQEQLGLLTNEDDSVSEKMLSYNRANRAVAILCNHQRSVPKSHDKSMSKLKEKIETKKDAIKDAERQVKDAQRDAKHGSVKEKTVYDKKKKLLQRLREQLVKLEVQETDRDENKTIALGTSKLNYLDPRISVAWCKKYEVPIEKVYNKTQRDKFRWAIDMAGPDYVF